MSSANPDVLFLTKYDRSGASSRYRTLQYLPYFEQMGIRCEVSPLFDDVYLAHRYQLGQGRWNDILSAFLRRLNVLLRVRRFDLIVIEKEMLPYMPAALERLLEWLETPYVVDYDDALFHQYDQHSRRWIRMLLGGKIAQVMRRACLVIAGNAYLANYAQHAGARHVEVIPTVVDLDRYPSPSRRSAAKGAFIIGWIGSPSTGKYLKMVASALEEVCADDCGEVRLIGAGMAPLPGVPIKIVPWSEATEVESLHGFDIGIMPLPDQPWERGKCGFKLIQYMACGLPVIASPVGVNAEIVEEGRNGYLATDHASWVDALMRLRDDAGLRDAMGRSGREKVERQYCLQIMAPKMAALLKSAAAE